MFETNGIKMIAPKKSLGQNFLTDKNISRKIVAAIAPTAGDFILEIGPGTGALTELLAETEARILAVEIDKRAVEVLQSKFAQKENLRIVHEDFSKFDFRVADEFASGERLKVAGNIPYYLTSEIIFRLIENSSKISRVVLMIQKEVAQRLVAQPRTKDYGILTVAIGLCARAKILFDVPPSCFFPRPKVTSSVIEITFKRGEENLFDNGLMRFVRAAFNQRRKTLSNSLSAYSVRECPEFAEYLNKRAEELTFDEFHRLYYILESR